LTMSAVAKPRSDIFRDSGLNNIDKRRVAETLCYSSSIIIATILCEHDTTFGEN